MKQYKGLLIDIDNTLYDYDNCHNQAMKMCEDYMESKLGVNKISFLNAFKTARETIHIRLHNTASSHNRLLYFQMTLELLNINSLKYSLELYHCYWDNFLNLILPEPEIDYLFKKYIGRICFVTDLTADIQHKKIQQMNLNLFDNFIVTSEEAGIEKPNKLIFEIALNKLKLNNDEVCMIGDSYEKDIIGASNIGIDAIWINKDNKINKVLPNCIEIKRFSEINLIL